MLCSKCGTDNAADARFCNQCATPLARACLKCAHLNAADAKFCSQCAAALGGQKVESKASDLPLSLRSIRVVTEEDGAPHPLDGERKTVTALFADIKGSMDLMEDLDPEEARAIVDPALKLMMDAVHRYGGYVAQSTGDGIFALFGAPIAREDHPQRALYAALRMQEQLRGYSSKLVADGGMPLETRVGVNTGEVVVRSIATGGGHVEYTPIGHSTSLAARMQAVAPTGSVAVAEATRKLCEGYFILRPMGATKVKGVSEPVNVYEVTGLGPLRTRLQRSAGRGLTKFVGREREMDALKHAAEQAKSGHGQIVAAMAEPGVGKSRLFFEFKATNAAGWLVLEALSVSHGKGSTYLPVIDLLNGYFKILAEDDQRERREKVNRKVLTLDRSLEDTIPYVFALLGMVEGDGPLAQMDAQVRRRRTHEAIKRLLARESLNQPLMVIFEDLHWIDEETQALLNLLADSIGTSKILLLFNYRPEYSHQWGGKTYYTQLRLDPLGKESADEMLNALLGEGRELVPLKRLIIERTEGNPFFIEEMVQMLLDGGALVRNGAPKLTRSLSELKIPPTVQAILASRIDRLPATEKDLLQTIAVIGKEFPFALVREVTGLLRDELERILESLQLAEFIYELPTAGDVEYTFKHALTHQVAYDSQLVARRKELHERTADAVEAVYSGQLHNWYDDLARHYQLGGNLKKAVDYLELAAGQALQRSALGAALLALDTALGLLASLPDSPERRKKDLDLLVAKYTPLAVTLGYAAREVEELNGRLVELCRQVGGDSRQLMTVSFAVQSVYFLKGDLAHAIAIDEELIEEACKSGDIGRITLADYLMGNKLIYAGRLIEARGFLEKAISEHQPGTLRAGDYGSPEDTAAGARGYLAAALLWLGYPEKALHRAREGVRLARELSHPYTIAGALVWCGYVMVEIGSVNSAMEAYAEAVDISERFGIAQWLAFGMLGRAVCLALVGNASEGVAEAQLWRDGIIAAGLELSVGLTAIDQARCLLRAGLLGEACHTVESALEAVQRTGQLTHEADLIRLRGKILLRRDSASEEVAIGYFEDAIKSAQACKAKFYELRATTCLARLLAKTARRDEARAMLAEIYKWFTEGFDTADLKDAKALLDELSA